MHGIVRVCLLLSVLGCQVRRLTCEKILLIPNPTYSVCRSLVNIGEELQRKGHEVVVYTLHVNTENCLGNNGMRTITYPLVDLDLRAQIAKSQALMHRVSMAQPWENTYHSINHLAGSATRMCKLALGDMGAIQKLRDEQFDVIVIDGSMQNVCYAVIPYVLKVPVAVYGSMVFSWPGPHLFRPTQCACLSPCSEAKTLTDIALNAVTVIYNYLYFVYSIPIQEVNRVAPGLSRKQTVDLLFSAPLYIYNDDHFLGYPHPPSPKVVMVGGIMTRPVKPLPDDINQFLNRATKGAILVAFGGTSFRTMPKDFQDKFTRAFSDMNLSILWKSSVNLTEGNIMKKTWLPMFDVLAHKNIRLLIYHCGRNGFFESVYHGVPLICLPIMYDQNHYAARLESLGIGEKLSLNSFDADDFRDIIYKILNDKSYKLNAVKLSNYFHRSPKSPVERAAYWIEHLMKNGDSDFQNSADTSPSHTEMILLGLLLCLLVILPLWCFYRFLLWVKFTVCSKGSFKTD